MSKDFSRRKGRIFYFCFDTDFPPTGGIKKIYQHVDILNALGLAAFVVHSRCGFRCSWFFNETPIAYGNVLHKPFVILDADGMEKPLPLLSPEDILVYPEVITHKRLQQIVNFGFSMVIFNQNAYNTFLGTSFTGSLHPEERQEETIYKHKNLLGSIVVSEDSKKYLAYAFPTAEVFHVHIAIDFKIFSYQKKKKKQLAYMPRKCKKDSQQVLCMLQERGLLKDWTVVPIENMVEEQVAHVLKESALFLSFSEAEGLGLPPMEAMSSGAIVIGYHGGGGKEYFKGATFFPIPNGELVRYAKTVEKVALDYAKDPGSYSKLARAGSDFIQSEYSLAREKEELMQAWKVLLRKK